MCGICGAVGLSSQKDAETVVRRMTNAMVHRGPDAEGLLSVPGVTVGMRRLSIIDVAGGAQPVWNEDRTLAVVFNGEIYNFGELRDELLSLGHRFTTSSDTEVIVHAYESWGAACTRRFHGMFVFAIVEMPAGPAASATAVFLARDPFGIKPLYYTLLDGALLFASEVGSLLASGTISPQLSSESIASYLLFGSISEPDSLLKDVFSLPPGHQMRIPANRPFRVPDAQSYAVKIAGTMRDINPRNCSAQSETPQKQVRHLLEQAVHSHLAADVPVGVFLSSGIDSTALATLASRAQPGIHTFTVAFPDLEFSEAEIARRTAAQLGTQHQELNLSSEEMLSRLDEAVDGLDLPSQDGINTYFVSWAAQQAGLKVALSGLGSDEIFGGYRTFRDTAALQRVTAAAQVIPRPVRDIVARIATTAGVGGSPDARQKALAAWRNKDSLPEEYFFTRLLFTPNKVAEATHANPSSWRSTRWWQWFEQALKQAEGFDTFTKVSWLELRSYMVNTLLRDTDAMSMKHSLEVRVPFLDIPLVDYALSLSADEKGAARRPKWLLIEALRDVLPTEIVTQRKRTFTFPWDNWLRGALRNRLEQGLADWSPALAVHVDRNFAQNVWRDFLAGHTSWSRPWSLFVLNEWVKRHVDVATSQNPNRRGAEPIRVA
jgi:asparagine synthase (glutamine-hydrolysing)